MAQNQWYVITGGPSSGKTTILEVLAKQGYTIFPEAARVVIDEGIAKGLSIERIRGDEKQFQLDVLKHKLAVESQHDPNVLTFFDRGMHDTLAYMQAHAMEIEAVVETAMRSSRYKKVFLLEPLDHFEQDYARTEDETFRKKITSLLQEAYKDAGMGVIRVPAMSVDKRADFVLKHIS